MGNILSGLIDIKFKTFIDKTREIVNRRKETEFLTYKHIIRQETNGYDEHDEFFESVLIDKDGNETPATTVDWTVSEFPIYAHTLLSQFLEAFDIIQAHYPNLLEILEKHKERENATL